MLLSTTQVCHKCTHKLRAFGFLEQWAGELHSVTEVYLSDTTLAPRANVLSLSLSLCIQKATDISIYKILCMCNKVYYGACDAIRRARYASIFVAHTVDLGYLTSIPLI